MSEASTHHPHKKRRCRREANSGRVLDPTCFAVLFLKKAALPVATGRRGG